MYKTTAPKGFLLSESPWRLGPRPRIFPRERLFGFRYRVFGRHLVAQPGFEPGSRGHEPRMLPLHYSAILQGRFVAFYVPKTYANKFCCLCLFLYKYYIKIFKESQISFGWSGGN